MARKIAPFGAAVVLAFLVVALVRATDATEAVAYVLTGFTAGVLLVGGILFAFGGGLKQLDVVEAHVPAAVAKNGDGDVAATQLQRIIFPFNGRDEAPGIAQGPGVVPARWTGPVRVQAIQVLTEAVNVRHETPA